jgi:hypothetical protein
MKNVLILLLAVVSFNFIQAQRFEGGILGGLTASQVDGDTYSGFHQVGIHFGGFTRTQFNPRWAGQMELKYSARGASRAVFTEEEISNYNLKLRYVSIPVVVQFFLTDNVFFDGGISPAYLVNRVWHDSSGKLEEDEIKEKGDFRKFDLDGILGINYVLNKNVSLSIRYAYSIIPIRKRLTGNAWYGLLARMIGYTEGDYNNFLTFGVYYNFK